MPRTGWSSSRNLQQSIRETFIDPDHPVCAISERVLFLCGAATPLLKDGSEMQDSANFKIAEAQDESVYWVYDFVQMSRNPKALGAYSFVLHERGAHGHHWSGTGSLSIKSFTGCEAFYDVGRGFCKVDDSSYLILNTDQDYSISIEDASRGESFCIFFEDGFAERVHHSLSRKTTQLLDNPDASSTEPIHFFDKTYPHDSVLSPALSMFKAGFPPHKEETGWVHEQLYEMMRRLLNVHQNVRRDVEQIDSVRASTREELYRRLHRARDFMAACLDQPLTLEDIARVACLSPNHLLRTFKQVFRQTPHQFLTSKRLDAAARLLARTDLSICDVCLNVGFEGVGSFSTLFSRSFGIPPGKYRLSKR